MNRLRNCKTEKKVHISLIHWQSSKTFFIPRNHYLCTCVNDLALVKSSTTGWCSKSKTSSLSREKTLFKCSGHNICEVVFNNKYQHTMF